VLATSASGLPEDAEAMSVVHHQERVVALTEARDLVERSQVAVHRIDAVDDDEPARVVLTAPEDVLQLDQVVVREDP
jgi:hypothetical protein